MVAEVDKFAFSHMALGYLMKGLACGVACDLHVATFVDGQASHELLVRITTSTNAKRPCH